MKKIEPGDKDWEWNLYDPPSGWQYGFPKPYRPLLNETLKETLIRDGYPRHLLEGKNEYNAHHCRFIGRRGCPHNEGWWLLKEHYGEDNDKWCCHGGCGKTITQEEYENLNGTD